MVRIIPQRLKTYTTSSTNNSTANSRSTSPMPLKLDAGVSEGRRDTGLVLKITILRARNLAAKDRGGTSDPDRFGKDYLGEFDLALEEIFSNEKTEQEAKWYPLKSKKPGKKKNNVSGEVLLQCTLFDSTDKDATDAQILEKLHSLATALPESASRNATPNMTPMLGPTSTSKLGSSPSPQLSQNTTDGSQDDDDDDEILDDDETPEDEDPSKPDAVEKRKRRLRIKGLKRKRRQNPYEFVNGGSDVVGLIFLEICNITDLPPESNFTKTSFDMDPFVVASLGKKTYRTRVVRHNLNPVFNEKMLFHVLNHEQSYSFAFTVIDRDKYSGNDFIASTSFPLQELTEKSPKANPETGLYDLKEPAEYVPVQKSRLARLGLSRSSSTQSLGKNRPVLPKNPSVTSATSQEQVEPKVAPTSIPNPGLLQPEQVPNLNSGNGNGNGGEGILASYVATQYDADESGEISKVELTTMLDTLGSTLRESTIDSFFQRFPHKAGSGEQELTMDEAVICLEDQLDAKSKSAPVTDKLKNMLPDAEKVKNFLNPSSHTGSVTPSDEGSFILSAEDSTVQGTTPGTSTIVVPDLSTSGEEGDALDKDDLNIDRGEEHVVEIREFRKLLKSLSIKQGKKYDDPASKAQIPGFVQFHQLDMSEVLLPAEEFKNFNEFFYRALKPNARPCSAPDNPHIIVSPADCRSVVFNSIDSATNIWIKGREFSIKRLLGDAYPEDAKRYENGALGIFRLAPQDYHRFHIPVDGILRKPKLIAGEYYTVNPMAIRSALDVYGENVRVLCPIDTELFGRVMVICVGAMMVGSTVITRNDGEEVKRAEELGYFKFGGSTIVTLFEPRSRNTDSSRHVGWAFPTVPQFTPDIPRMRKTLRSGKAEAHRRIRGGGDSPDEVPLP
ncbi:Phosphatidylserine decarboxylase proenzyme 3 [Daldinia childiae]|uniref:Phosphatidylserine decarboxylase proenzyme 3 n=1 Tax=Daldinia childiae TaxID=326645 RepID=UPI001444B09D|nr:Phosphatidylserine decarboxylase proenzyme 3 [Daldinia childiae]KAF3058133.1 Phosphatidylserine decarboxylase proenzyme 3 [Daldinia childiae]